MPSNQADILNDIDATIYPNGVNAITGGGANGILKEMYRYAYLNEIPAIGVQTGPVTAADSLHVAISRLQNQITGLGSGYIPLAGTANGYPLTGTIEKESSLSSAGMLAVKSYLAIGAADDIDFDNLATEWATINFQMNPVAASKGVWLDFNDGTNTSQFSVKNSFGVHYITAFSDYTNFAGINYAADYSAHYGSRSLPDVGWVTAQVGAGWNKSGNALSGGEKLGSTNNNPVDIYTNNNRRIRVLGSGQTLFGTTVWDGFSAIQNAVSGPIQNDSVSGFRFNDAIYGAWNFTSVGTGGAASLNIFHAGVGYNATLTDAGWGLGIGNTSPLASLHVQNYNNTTKLFKFDSFGGTERMFMNDNGQVGLNTATLPSVTPCDLTVDGRMFVGRPDNTNYMLIGRYNNTSYPFGFIQGAGSYSAYGTAGVCLATSDAGTSRNTIMAWGNGRVSLEGTASPPTVPNAYFEVRSNSGSGIDIQRWFGGAGSQILAVTDTGSITMVTGQTIDASGGTLNLGTNATIVNIGTGTGAKIINVGSQSTLLDQINLYGTILRQDVTNLAVADKLVTYNVGGAAASGYSSGWEGEENSVITYYFKTDATSTGFVAKASSTYEATFLLSSLTGNSIFKFPNLNNKTLATIDGNQTFSSGTWNGSPITESYLSITDVTAGNFSTTAHGFVPKGTNVGNFLKDDGTWSAVSQTLAGLNDVTITSIADGQLLKYSAGSSKWINFTPAFVSTALTSAYVYVGNGSNIAAPVQFSGAFTITNAGVATIGSSYVTNGMLAGSIAYGKLSLTNSIVSGDIVSLVWSKVSATPTTVSGYGITDIISQAITGFSSGAGTVSASDTILQAFQKLDGNVGLKAPISNPVFTGTVTLGQDATSSYHAVTYQQMLAAFASLDSKASVAYAATSPLPAYTYNNGSSGVGATWTGTSNGPLIIDGVTILLAQAGESVLIAGEGSTQYNGWATITQVGVLGVSPYILTRRTDSDQATEIGAGYLTGVVAPNGVVAGSNNGKVFISIANDPFVVGTTGLTFSQVGSTYSTGAGLSTSGTVFSIDFTRTNTWTGGQTFNSVSPIFGTMTIGSVLYAGTGGLLTQDNSNFYFASHLLSVQTGGDFLGTDSINVYKQIDSFTPNSSDNGYSASHARGSVGSFTESLANDYIGLYGFYPYNGTSWVEGASIRGYVEGATAANRGGRLEFWTKTNAGSITQALVIDSNQKITVGIWNATKVAEIYGGTNQSTYTLGDMIYASAANTLSKLAGNTAALRKNLTQTGTGSVSAAPTWNTPYCVNISSAASQTVSATTNEEVIYSVLIPAGTAVANGMLYLKALFSTTSSANNKTFKLYLGTGAGTPGSALPGGATQIATYVVTTNAQSANIERWFGIVSNTSIISQANATTSRRDSLVDTSTTPAAITVPTLASDTYFIVTGQKASSGETLTGILYLAQIFNN